MSTPQPIPGTGSVGGNQIQGSQGGSGGAPNASSVTNPVFVPSTPSQSHQPQPGSIPNPTPSSLTRTSSLSRPPGRRPSASFVSNLNGIPGIGGSSTPQPPATPGGSVARRPSRAQHPPMAVATPSRHLSHDEAIEALRAFLKERSSYDVFPVSFRLIVLDSQLKVKKALDVLLLYGESALGYLVCLHTRGHPCPAAAKEESHQS